MMDNDRLHLRLTVEDFREIHMTQPLERKVTQDNALISASYSMTLDEKRLLMALISKIDPTSKAWKTGSLSVEITITEWAELYSIKGGNTYERLNEASKRLYNRSVRIKGDSKKGKEIRWLSAREYNEGEGVVILTFANPILKYLTSLFDQFTSYDLLGVSGLKSMHSVRLYELACQYKSTGWRYMTLDELREALDLQDSYVRWVDLRKYVLDKSCREVTQKSDYIIAYEAVKKGRGVDAIKLFIKPKDQLELEL